MTLPGIRPSHIHPLRETLERLSKKGTSLQRKVQRSFKAVQSKTQEVSQAQERLAVQQSKLAVHHELRPLAAHTQKNSASLIAALQQNGKQIEGELAGVIKENQELSGILLVNQQKITAVQNSLQQLNFQARTSREEMFVDERTVLVGAHRAEVPVVWQPKSAKPAETDPSLHLANFAEPSYKPPISLGLTLESRTGATVQMQVAEPASRVVDIQFSSSSRSETDQLGSHRESLSRFLRERGIFVGRYLVAVEDV